MDRTAADRDRQRGAPPEAASDDDAGRGAAGGDTGRPRLRELMAAQWRRHAPAWLPRLRLAAFAVAGAVLAVVVAGRVGATVGPFETTFSVRPSFHGYSLVRLAPLGSIELDTHDWPLALDVRVDEVGVAAAERIAGDPTAVETIGDEVAAEVRDGLADLALRCALLGVAGGAIGALVARVRWQSAVAGGAVGALLVSAVGAGTAVTFDADAVAEPRYTGLLTMAPRAVGDIETVIDRYGEYRVQLSDLVENVATLYLAGENLPTFSPTADTIRIMHVSDVHLNPQAFDLMRQVTEQFAVDAIVDTGDLTDWGTSLETRFVEEIRRLDVPYVYVRGNHDSRAVQAAVAGQPNTVVLDGEAATVAGVRIWGVGDPRYTPDKDAESVAEPEKERAEAVAPAVADAVLDAAPPAVDVVAVHDERMAGELGGAVSLVLAGHTHDARQDVIAPVTDDDRVGRGDVGEEAERGDENLGDEATGDGQRSGGADSGDETGDETRDEPGEETGDDAAEDETTGDDAAGDEATGDGRTAGDATSGEGSPGDEGRSEEPTILLVEGSTGGAGLRGLQGDEPEPLAASVLYFDATTKRLLAYDRLTVTGLGETGATIERHVVPPLAEEAGGGGDAGRDPAPPGDPRAAGAPAPPATPPPWASRVRGRASRPGRRGGAARLVTRRCGGASGAPPGAPPARPAPRRTRPPRAPRWWRHRPCPGGS